MYAPSPDHRTRSATARRCKLQHGISYFVCGCVQALNLPRGFVFVGGPPTRDLHAPRPNGGNDHAPELTALVVFTGTNVRWNNPVKFAKSWRFNLLPLFAAEPITDDVHCGYAKQNE